MKQLTVEQYNRVLKSFDNAGCKLYKEDDYGKQLALFHFRNKFIRNHLPKKLW